MKKELRWAPLALALLSTLARGVNVDRTSTITYNADGMVEIVDGPRTDILDKVYYAYDAQGHLFTTTNALGHVIRYEDYDLPGRPGKITDANGVLTLLTYTPEGWLQTLTRDANGVAALTTLTYDAVGKVVQTSDPDGVIARYTYDDAGRLANIVDGVGNRLHYVLDAAGNRIREETIDVAGATRRTISRSFNNLSQLLTVTDALNHTTLSFDLTDGYDALGNAIHSRDGRGVQQKRGYDALNRLVSTVNDYDGVTSDTANSRSSSTFDANDNLTAIRDPSGLDTIYERNEFGDLVGIHSPDTGRTSFSVDSAGNRISATDARGVVAKHGYDALNRLVSTSYADGSLNIVYHYDEANAVTGCSASFPVGRVTRIVEEAITTIYCYDAQGNVAEKRQIQDAVTDMLRYSYTPGRRVLSETRPSGNVVRYDYDALGHVSSVSLSPNGGASITVASEIIWLPFGPMEAYKLGNGQTVTRTFDANYRVTAVASPIISLHFLLDEMGNVVEVNESGSGSASYLYDPLYRLISVNDHDSTAIEAYTYNPTGDRLSKTAAGIYTGIHQYKLGTHWLISAGAASRTYDANGNTTSSTAGGDLWAYEYNGRNHMSAVQRNGTMVSSYVYNASGERVAKTVGTVSTRFFYDDRSHLLSEASGNVHRDYIVVAGIPLAVVDGNSIGFITADGLGSPRIVTSPRGDLVWKWPYANNVFGERMPVSTSGYVLNLRFPGQYADDEVALVYNIHRYFDPATGRYLQADPLGLSAGPSLYSYVGSDPLNAVDRLGLCISECDAIIPMKPEDVSISDNVYVMESLKQLSYVSGGIGVALKYRSFYELVRNGGRWDFKQIKPEYADFGNFHYGVVGKAGGIPDAVLLRAAGWAQTRSGNHVATDGYPLGGAPYGDDPADQKQIRNGIWWYNNCSASSN